MAEMTIRLRTNPTTGKKDIVISLRSDDDALPHEHEQQHRQLVDKLIEGGVLSQDEVGSVVVEREEEEQVSTPTSQSKAEDQRESLGEGQ